MFKKTTSLLLSLCLLFCLSACDAQETSNASSSTPTKSQTETTQDITETQTVTNQSTTTSTTTQPEPTSTTNQTELISTTTKPKPTNTTTQQTHKHNFSNATCTSPKKCSCGATEGEALGHKFENGVCAACNTIDEETYVAAQVNAADMAFADYTKYDEALKIIKTAIQRCPNNAILKSKRDYYQSFAPVYLSDVEPYSKTTWFKLLDEDKDVFDNTHYHCIRIEKNCTTAEGVYDLSARYNTFSATVFGLGDGNSGSLEIYADGVCVYSNVSINPDTRPFEITLDITGVMDLKFVMKQQYNSYTGECFGLSDVHIQKNVK